MKIQNIGKRLTSHEVGQVRRFVRSNAWLICCRHGRASFELSDGVDKRPFDLEVADR